MRKWFSYLRLISSTFASVLDHASSGFGILLLIGMTGLTFVSVISRYVFNKPIVGTEDLMGFMVAWSVLILLGSVSRRDRHIRMTFFITKLLGEERAKKVWITVENLCGLGLCSYFFWQGLRWVLNTYNAGLFKQAAAFNYPMWTVRVIAPLALGLAALFYLERCIRQISNIVANRRNRMTIPDRENDITRR
ncbi:TRAP transporter small permease [Chloroflexota bacterium]